ncbi:MAG: bifunctional methionine sulfoxide reductase B/A protein [Bacteroidales bacterium]|nr:bifunctional methionine sulfoxide reductase B/A protein [Bacteroidales bacterium]
MKYNKLNKEEERVILHKGTERPHTGIYNDFFEEGTYNCKQCGTVLYKSDSKFDGHCGWPSFDDEIEGAVKRIPDADGMRTEIVCANCGGHLGHVFLGEGYTDKNTRHCVNSVSLSFTPLTFQKFQTFEKLPDKDTAIFASGCFWGTEHWMKKQKGVIFTEVGYIGGHVRNPTYEQVCSHTTGHAEAVKVVFNPDEVTYKELAKLFFETHDPTQVDRQGPDIGNQYRSEIVYTNDKQKEISEKLIKQLEAKGFKVATKLTEAPKFWKAEDYHQDYYEHKGTKPYCQFYTKRF